MRSSASSPRAPTTTHTSTPPSSSSSDEPPARSNNGQPRTPTPSNDLESGDATGHWGAVPRQDEPPRSRVGAGSLAGTEPIRGAAMAILTAEARALLESDPLFRGAR